MWGDVSNSYKCLRQNRTNLRHFGPRGWGSDGQNSQLGWCKSDPGSDKEARQRMEVRSTFGQGPLAERKFSDELWELWVTMKWQMPGQQRQRLVGSVFGQIGPTGWKVGRFRTKMPKFRKFCPDKNWRFREILGSNIYGDYRGRCPIFVFSGPFNQIKSTEIGPESWMILLRDAHIPIKTVLKWSNSTDPRGLPCSELNNPHHLGTTDNSSGLSFFFVVFASSTSVLSSHCAPL